MATTEKRLPVVHAPGPGRRGSVCVPKVASNLSPRLATSLLIPTNHEPCPKSAAFRRGQQPYPAGFPLPFGVLAFACWDIFSLLGDSAFLAVGLPSLDSDPDRVSTFRMNEKQPGWAPSLLRGLDVWTDSRLQPDLVPLSPLCSRCDDLD
jgi:hypothetical protein